MTEPTLKKCPFCGSEPDYLGDSKTGFTNIGCSNENCFISHEATRYKIWNEAYCWKQLDSANAKVGRLEKELEQYKKGK